MITLSGLEKSFAGQQVLQDISLNIAEGSVTRAYWAIGKRQKHAITLY
ncbi:Uncharacterised protein [Raoultella terrigena]|uniref:Uncharacterized protein n=1 Tax=Raoultella terrigena TaxID=577 RepID=A0A485CIQ4_RAOTE|nr:Uncharacterised protein [Raoultella terrigena]